LTSLEQLIVQVRSSEDSQELEAVHTLHSRYLDVDGSMWVSISPEVHNELLGLLSVAPLSQTNHLLHVGGLVAVFNEANHHGVICKPNDVIRTIDRSAVMSEEGEEEGTHHTALWYTGVHCDYG